MRFFQVARTSTIVASALITSIIMPQNLQPNTAFASLFAPDQHTTFPFLSSQNHPPDSWKHTAWEHWNTTGLDPEHTPYSVVFIGKNLQNIPPDYLADAIQASIDTWNSVDCATPQLRFAGFRDDLNAVSDHEIPIFVPNAGYWHDQQNLIASTNMNNPAIALNTTNFLWSLEPAPFQYLNQDPSTSAPLKPLIVDLQSVLTHELGHILGLWHTQDDATATMTAKYLPDAGQRQLAADDKFALCHLYPKPGNNPECTKNDDCPLGPCLNDGTFHVCQKNLANPGDYCALDLLHCPHSCIIDSPPTGTGYCTQSCQTDADCPSHLECKTSNDYSLCLIIRPESQETAPDSPGCSSTTQPSNPRQIITPILALLAIGILTTSRRRRKRRPPTIY